MISSTREDDVVTIWLDRPETRNALGLADWQALASLADDLRQSDCAAIILSSTAPRAFCSGSDLKEIVGLATDIPAREEFRLAMRAALDGIAELPVPVVAVIEGACFGAGVALALACDMRIAGPEAQFGVPPAKLGISYPVQDIRRLVGAVGRAQAARLLFSAQAIGAEEAADHGLVDAISATPAQQARALAEQMAANDPASVRALKTTLSLVDADSDGEMDALFDAMFGSAGFAARSARLAKA